MARFAFSAQFYDGHPVVCRVVEDCPQSVVERQYGIFHTWTHANALACQLNELFGIDRLEARFIATQAFLLGEKLSTSGAAAPAPLLINDGAVEAMIARPVSGGLHVVSPTRRSLRDPVLPPAHDSGLSLNSSRVQIENREVRLRLVRTRLRLAITHCECARLVPTANCRMLQRSLDALEEASVVVASFDGELFAILDIEAMAGRLEMELREIRARTNSVAISRPPPPRSIDDPRSARFQRSASQELAEPIECLTPAFGCSASRGRFPFVSLIHRKLGFPVIVRK